MLQTQFNVLDPLVLEKFSEGFSRYMCMAAIWVMRLTSLEKTFVSCPRWLHMKNLVPEEMFESVYDTRWTDAWFYY